MCNLFWVLFIYILPLSSFIVKNQRIFDINHIWKQKRIIRLHTNHSKLNNILKMLINIYTYLLEYYQPCKVQTLKTGKTLIMFTIIFLKTDWFTAKIQRT